MKKLSWKQYALLFGLSLLVGMVADLVDQLIGEPWPLVVGVVGVSLVFWRWWTWDKRQPS